MRSYLYILGMLIASCVMFLTGFIVVEHRTKLEAIQTALGRCTSYAGPSR
jgi:hypothetical protein